MFSALGRGPGFPNFCALDEFVFRTTLSVTESEGSVDFPHQRYWGVIEAIVFCGNFLHTNFDYLLSREGQYLLHFAHRNNRDCAL